MDQIGELQDKRHKSMETSGREKDNPFKNAPKGLDAEDVTREAPQTPGNIQ